MWGGGGGVVVNSAPPKCKVRGTLVLRRSKVKRWPFQSLSNR